MHVLVARGAADLRGLRRRFPGLRLSEFEKWPDVGQAVRHEVCGVVLRSTPRITEKDLLDLPALRWVIRPGSGTDNIDLTALRRRGITFVRRPEISADAIAEIALMSTLVVLRRAAEGFRGLTAGVHLKARCMGRTLAGSRVAIWGAGPVGRATGLLFDRYGAAVRYARWPSNPGHLAQADADRLRAESDIHVVALPLRPETTGIVDAAWLAKAAPRRPVLTCVGRMETLDLVGVAAALRAGQLFGLAIDPVDDEHVMAVGELLSAAPNVFVTPHVGGQRGDVRTELDRWVEGSIAERLEEVRV
ncbi:2-hydroxyacid dehydrogenase [Virgisporangium ochraceum]|uniref:2-hydroxyacid dehydrogenase n=1 Tax=Virgisporangium ochraceum TaxID=65505 RepID=A0A8J4A4Q9_9ACTN|nr:NAD(P)-dependent oxidoreductase [Virgisporangium ochraceum]GIJ72696.1 2-hydroxyacid dehydrogenase [Virgisporangium ochraceum]